MIGASAVSLLAPSYQPQGFGWETTGRKPDFGILSEKGIGRLEKVLHEIEKKERGPIRYLNQSQSVLAEYVQYFKMLAGLPFKLSRHDCIVPNTTITLTEKGSLKPCFYLRQEFAWHDHGSSPATVMKDFRRTFSRQYEECQSCMQFLCNEWIRPLAKQ
jgi:hypothetical protein